MGNFTSVSLEAACNAVAATYDENRRAGAINAWGNSLPAEEVPFGSLIEIGDIPFRLPAKQPHGDHVEAVGQFLALPSSPPVAAIALLCFGEMGDQEAQLTLTGRIDAEEQLSVRAPGWLWPAAGRDHAPPSALCCSHLHYPGYELASFQPTAACCIAWLSRPLEITGCRLAINPLFHILAVTLMHQVADDD